MHYKLIYERAFLNDNRKTQRVEFRIKAENDDPKMGSKKALLLSLKCGTTPFDFGSYYAIGPINI